MKKILSKLNPKNFSVTTQVFLIFFITFIIFLFTEILVVNAINKNTTKKFEQKAQITSINFFNSYNETENNFLQMQQFYDDYYSYVLAVDKDLNLIPTSSSILLNLNDTYFSIPILYEPLQVTDTINYTLDANNNITSINDYLYLKQTNDIIYTAEIKEIIYPDNINHIFYNNNEVSYVLEELKHFSSSDDIKNITSIVHNDLTLYVFIENFTDTNLIIIIPSLDDSTINANLNIFQGVMFISMLIVLLILIFLINHLLTEPIKNIVFVLNNNKNLNTEIIHASEYQNKEYRTLSNEINDLSDSLIEVIDNLNSKNTEINKYNEELNKEYQFKKQLVATISHEIKTPLAAMQATISGILDGIFEGEEANNELQNVLKEIENTNYMLHEIVQLYQLENANFRLNFELHDLTQMINSSITQCHKIAVKYNQNIVFATDSKVNIFADSKQMTRVLNNILLNAIIYSPPYNKITLEIKEFINHNILEIINYGVNISDDDINKVFEPFYRIDKSRKKSEDHGNGLGLYLVSETLKKHGFEYGIENIINGVKFYIIFPNINNSID